jgi:hypothetical protein
MLDRPSRAVNPFSAKPENRAPDIDRTNAVLAHVRDVSRHVSSFSFPRAPWSSVAIFLHDDARRGAYYIDQAEKIGSLHPP